VFVKNFWLMIWGPSGFLEWWFDAWIDFGLA